MKSKNMTTDVLLKNIEKALDARFEALYDELQEKIDGIRGDIDNLCDDMSKIEDRMISMRD